jgi:hypothetical protein
MPKWVKRPVVIDAVRYLGVNDDDVPQFDCFGEPLPKWLHVATVKQIAYVHRHRLLISTLEGVMVANTYDYIVRGLKGELYPCKPDIFEQTHQKVAA